jgi:hypothetical protein
LTQGTGAPSWPLPSQSWVALPEHCEVEGTQLPEQTPSVHAELTHSSDGPQVPVLLQVSTPFCTQRVLSGAHSPAQAPLTQAWPTQATALPQFPALSQVSTALPSHLLSPGAQLPTQAPLAHAWWLQAGLQVPPEADRSGPSETARSVPAGIARSRPAGIAKSRPAGTARSRPAGIARSNGPEPPVGAAEGVQPRIIASGRRRMTRMRLPSADRAPAKILNSYVCV